MASELQHSPSLSDGIFPVAGHTPELDRQRSTASLIPRSGPSQLRPPPTPPKSPATPLSPATPKSPVKAFASWATSPLRSPLPSPLATTLRNMKEYLQELGHLTTIDPRDTWLPITESRHGNAYYAAFHNVNASIGFQALLLPLAFTFLGWTSGIVCLIIAFCWMMYTKWLLVSMHECVPGKRVNRYLDLVEIAFGNGIGKQIIVIQLLILLGGTCIGLITIGGSCLQLFFRTVCPTCQSPLTPIEWYLVFTILCALLSYFPNLNSVAGVSLIGATMAVAYTTLLWTLSVSVPRMPNVGYEIVSGGSALVTTFGILNALGMIVFAFRGHNLVLEIQATMPSTLKHPARVPMWRGATAAFALTALCYFPLAIGGYWAYGDKMLPGGILYSLSFFHGQDISRTLQGTTFMFIVVNSLGSFQVYAMSIFDMIEQVYSKWFDRKCNALLRLIYRTVIVFLCFLGAVAIPFLSTMAGLIGGLTNLPVTFFLPSLMYLKVVAPRPRSFSWYLNIGLGTFGCALSIAVCAGGVYSIIETGIKLNFFKPA